MESYNPIQGGDLRCTEVPSTPASLLRSPRARQRALFTTKPYSILPRGSNIAPREHPVPTQEARVSKYPHIKVSNFLRAVSGPFPQKYRYYAPAKCPVLACEAYEAQKDARAGRGRSRAIRLNRLDLQEQRSFPGDPCRRPLAPSAPTRGTDRYNTSVCAQEAGSRKGKVRGEERYPASLILGRPTLHPSRHPGHPKRVHFV